MVLFSTHKTAKAFLYNVNGRGQTLTKQFPNMQQKLEERSVPSSGFGDTTITIVPADPNVEIPSKKKNLEGTTKDEKKKSDNEMKSAMNSEKVSALGYWLPRHEMVKLMAECIDEHNASSENKIDFLLGQECVDILPTNNAHKNNFVCVTAKNKNGELNLHQATLVVGADGMNSKVRHCLAKSPSNVWQSYKGFKPNKFILKRWTSPASHQRIKVLQLPPQFEIPNANGKPPLKTFSEEIYALRSVNTGPRNYLSLGLLPMKDNNAVRPTNIVTRPDHEVWGIKDGNAMQAYFQKSFPRFNFNDNGMISEEEWDRFAKAEGTRFPHCQYSDGLSVYDPSGTSGVALVGDAIHAFPPDIGQGVNAGLMDVVCLDRSLKGLDTETGDEISNNTDENQTTLQSNLERYQKQHSPETAALIRLARFGAPYQYKQPHRIDQIRRKLWTINVVFRLLLSKLTFGFIQPSCIILSQDNKLTFRQVMRRADRTTILLKTLTLAAFGLMMKQRLGFIGLPTFKTFLAWV